MILFIMIRLAQKQTRMQSTNRFQMRPQVARHGIIVFLISYYY